MIISKNINVNANFDSGTFIGTFSIHKNSKSYNHTDNSIQDNYNLTFDEFNILETLIATAVEQYLEIKETR